MLPSWGRTAVTPVRTVSPRTIVVWPTRTPGTSVMAFNGPGESTPGVIERSRARGFGCALRSNTPSAKTSATQNRRHSLPACPAPPAAPALPGITARARSLVISFRRMIEVRDAHTGLVHELRDAGHLVELDLRHVVGVRVV